MRKIAFISVLGLVAGTLGCGNNSSPSVSRDQLERPSMDKINLDGSYGTLKYKGVVERSLEKSDCRYTVKNLSLKYSVFSTLNMTKEIRVSVALVATQRPQSGEGSWKRIFEQTQKTGYVLTLTSPKATITNLVFTIPKEVVEQADHVGLSVTDGKFLWPIGDELKAEPGGAANGSQPIRSETNTAPSEADSRR